MATFNPLDVNTAIDTRLLVAWREGFTIEAISINPSTTVELRDFDPGGPSSPDLILTYSSSTTMGATGLTPSSGTFTSVTYLFEGTTTGGTLSGISPAALFSATVTADAYRIFDGSDTINGSTLGGDLLFAGFGGNDVLDGKGGGDNFYLSTRGASAPVLTIVGVNGADDTIFIEKNPAGDDYLSLTASTLTGIDAISLASGVKLLIKSSQIGAGIASDAVIGAFSGTATLDVDVGAGGFDAGSLQLHPNTLLRVFGTSAAETLSGTENADHFFSRPGADTINGRGGNDTFWLEGSGDEFDTFNGGSGVDTVRVQGTATPVLNGFNAKTASIEEWIGEVKGNDGGNVFDFSGLTEVSQFVAYGAGGNDTIIAPGFGLTMLGEAGKDTLVGGKGKDLAVGGLGADALTGGGEADIFGYLDIKESGQKKPLRDTITDFAKGDRIWLFVDANKNKAEYQPFKFVKKEGADFKKKPGTVIWEQIDKAGTAKDMTVLYADNNGDQKADMAIQLKGLIDLKAADFYFGFP
jgi:hypothetical protein